MPGSTHRQEAHGLGNFESNDRNQSVRLLCNTTRPILVSYKKKSAIAHENVAVFELEFFYGKAIGFFFNTFYFLFTVLSIESVVIYKPAFISVRESTDKT